MKNLFVVRYYRPEVDHLERVDTVVAGFENAVKIHKENLGFGLMPAIYTAAVREDGVITADTAVKELVNNWLTAEAAYADQEANSYYFDDAPNMGLIRHADKCLNALRAVGIEPPKYEAVKGDAYYRDLLGC